MVHKHSLVTRTCASCPHVKSDPMWWDRDLQCPEGYTYLDSVAAMWKRPDVVPVAQLHQIF